MKCWQNLLGALRTAKVVNILVQNLAASIWLLLHWKRKESRRPDLTLHIDGARRREREVLHSLRLIRSPFEVWLHDIIGAHFGQALVLVHTSRSLLRLSLIARGRDRVEHVHEVARGPSFLRLVSPVLLDLEEIVQILVLLEPALVLFLVFGKVERGSVHSVDVVDVVDFWHVLFQ